MRVARSRLLVAKGYPTATVARCLRISRQAIYRVPRPRRPLQRRAPSGPLEAAIVETARANPTDGYRMVTALVRHRLGTAVNRKRGAAGHARAAPDPAASTVGPSPAAGSLHGQPSTPAVAPGHDLDLIGPIRTSATARRTRWPGLGATSNP